MLTTSGVIRSAELCTPLADVCVSQFRRESLIQKAYSNTYGQWELVDLQPDDKITLTKSGFIAKCYLAQGIPQIIRLLEDRLIGYQDKLWFYPGDNVNLYVNAPVSFSATVYRHGLEKHCVEHLGEYAPVAQIVPDGYFVDSGLNWSPTIRYHISENAEPGLYSVLLTAEGQEPFAVPFVLVTPSHQYGKSSRLLVLASTTTWQSYNVWGGRSRYRNFEEALTPDYITLDLGWKSRLKKVLRWLLPRQYIDKLKRVLHIGQELAEPWMFDRLSIKRPFTNCALEDGTVFMPFTNHLAAGEWRLLAWLEREGIPYDIISGYDLHTSTTLLENYQAIILSTHCEYWTSEMYEALKYYHEQQGLWILNLAGNTLYRQIEFFPDGSTHCVSLLFHRSCADESQILGVRFTEYDYGTCAPYKILAPNHWVFRGVSEEVKSFGGLSLNQYTPKRYTRYDPGRPGLEYGIQGMGASGWEMDKLTRTAPSDICRVAKGMNRGGGADMVVRDPSGARGGMFSVSSVCFGGSLLIDYVSSAIVCNVLKRALNNDFL